MDKKTGDTPPIDPEMKTAGAISTINPHCALFFFKASKETDRERTMGSSITNVKWSRKALFAVP